MATSTDINFLSFWGLESFFVRRIRTCFRIKTWIFLFIQNALIICYFEFKEDETDHFHQESNVKKSLDSKIAFVSSFVKTSNIGNCSKLTKQTKKQQHQFVEVKASKFFKTLSIETVTSPTLHHLSPIPISLFSSIKTVGVHMFYWVLKNTHKFFNWSENFKIFLLVTILHFQCKFAPRSTFCAAKCSEFCAERSKKENSWIFLLANLNLSSNLTCTGLL